MISPLPATAGILLLVPLRWKLGQASLVHPKQMEQRVRVKRSHDRNENAQRTVRLTPLTVLNEADDDALERRAPRLTGAQTWAQRALG